MRYDSSERDRATSVEALTAHVDGDEITLRPRVHPLPDVAYGRRVRGSDGRTWLQYWFLYATNDQDRGVVRTGRHEGDWEVVQLRLGSGGRPDAATFAQHSWAEACPWRGTVYVAHASHASYPRAGEHGRPWPDPDDFADGRGRAVRPRIEPFGEWVRYPGQWGGRTPTGGSPARPRRRAGRPSRTTAHGAIRPHFTPPRGGADRARRPTRSGSGSPCGWQ